MSNEAGKGSKRRPCDEEKVRKNWPLAPRTVKLWDRDENGNLITPEE